LHPPASPARITAARLEDSAVPRYKFHYPTLLEVDGCTVAVVYTVGHKEHASAGGVKRAVLDLSKWAAKFGSTASPMPVPAWMASMSTDGQKTQGSGSEAKQGQLSGRSSARQQSRRAGEKAPLSSGRMSTQRGGGGTSQHLISLGNLAASRPASSGRHRSSPHAGSGTAKRRP